MSDYPYEAIVFLGDKDEIVEYTGDEVVRCKDCKYLNAGGNDVKYWRICTRQQKKYFDVYEDSFCSYGERKDT